MMPPQSTVTLLPRVIVAGVTEIVGPAGGSSSTMVTVALFGLPTVYPVPAPSVQTIVSLPSAMLSSIGVTVIAAEDCPVGIMTLPLSVW